MNDSPRGSSAFFDSSAISQLEQLSDEEFWNYARELAGITYSADTQQEYLECELASGPCLIPLATLAEVVLPPHRLTLLPSIPDWMLGMVAWRGEPIAVVDLDAYLSGSSDMHEPFTKGTLLVSEVGGVPMGLLVPRVGATTSISPDQSTMPPQTFAWYIPGRAKVTKDETLVLDLDALLANVVQQIGMPT